jgi:hypothetical protein
MNDLLRQYEPEECGEDGYPFAWHETQADDQTNRYPGDGPRLESPIKDLIRELADNRCERCGHPYTKGENEKGEWSACDDQCKHLGKVRIREAALAGEWEETELEFWGVNAAQARMDECPYGPLQRWDVEAQWRILTVHHLDEDKANCRWWNLVALCQRCHLRMQKKVVMNRPWHYDHTEWFKPYAAGFYAWKYLGENYSREETMAKLDELLGLELQGSKESLL